MFILNCSNTFKSYDRFKWRIFLHLAISWQSSIVSASMLKSLIDLILGKQKTSYCYLRLITVIFKTIQHLNNIFSHNFCMFSVLWLHHFNSYTRNHNNVSLRIRQCYFQDLKLIVKFNLSPLWFQPIRCYYKKSLLSLPENMARAILEIYAGKMKSPI